MVGRAFSFLKVQRGRRLGEDQRLFVGLDSEWKTKDGSNSVLSYQLFALDALGGPWRVIYYPKRERYGLPELLDCVIVEGLAQKRIVGCEKIELDGDEIENMEALLVSSVWQKTTCFVSE